MGLQPTRSYSGRGGRIIVGMWAYPPVAYLNRLRSKSTTGTSSSHTRQNRRGGVQPLSSRIPSTKYSPRSLGTTTTPLTAVSAIAILNTFVFVRAEAAHMHVQRHHASSGRSSRQTQGGNTRGGCRARSNAARNSESTTSTGKHSTLFSLSCMQRYTSIGVEFLEVDFKRLRPPLTRRIGHSRSHNSSANHN